MNEKLAELKACPHDTRLLHHVLDPLLKKDLGTMVAMHIPDADAWKHDSQGAKRDD